MRSPRDLQRYGGLLCLDFLNTLDWRGRNKPEEYLNAYRDLLRWSIQAGALTEREAQSLSAETGGKPGVESLARAIEFREAAYRVCLAAVKHVAPAARDLNAVNGVIANARSRGRLEYRNGSFSWMFTNSQNDLDLPLWTISLSFADLLTSGQLEYVRLCGGLECGWLFLDTTKNHKRRWCSMEGCGNRAKARRHYAKRA